MIRILTASALALVSVASFSVPASADTVRVGYADLNLSSNAGIKTLQHRVAAAITKVCGLVDPRDLSAASDIGKCRKTATASTIRQIAAVVDMSQRSASRDTGMQVASR